MGKADELLRTMGGTITESASHRGTPAAVLTGSACSAMLQPSASRRTQPSVSSTTARPRRST